MQTLAIDIETYSSVDLIKCGVYPYAESSDFEILLFGFAFDEDPVRVVDLAQGESLPAEVLSALTDPSILKTAYNAQFERVCLARWLGQPMPPEQWRCSMALAATLGLPGKLSAVADALRLSEDKKKMTAAGKVLIKYFSNPCTPTKANGGRTRNLPHHDPDKWAQYKMYNGRDVEVERAVRDKLAAYPLPEIEQRTWELDQRINETGVRIDLQLVNAARSINAAYQDKLTEEAEKLTGLDNPNSRNQLLGWLQENGVESDKLDKEAVAKLVDETPDPTVTRVLELRQDMAKSSISKYDAMHRSVCADGRVRGLLQYYGANRTGRWAGRLVQVQNLKRNDIKDLDLARQLVKDMRSEDIELVYDSLPEVLSQLIRTAFIPAEGHRFIVADFSAIEARVIAWLAGERWRMEVFETHGKIYEASASAMFGVPIDAVDKELRQRGKVAELALGYQGAVGALEQMDTEKKIDPEEYPGIVKRWRETNPNIVNYWYRVQDAAIRTIETGIPEELSYGVRFELQNNIMFIRLPSGRRLAYLSPRIVNNRFGGLSISYAGVKQQSRAWGRLETYGGKLVENIVQATARDCLRDAMLALDEAGYQTVMHVHDEAVTEVAIETIEYRKDRNTDPWYNREEVRLWDPNTWAWYERGAKPVLEDVCEIMSRPLPWAPGLPLRADGCELNYYRKE